MKNFLEYLEETSEYLVQQHMVKELGKMSGDMNEFDVLLISRPLGNKASRLDKYEDTSRPIEEYTNVEKWDMVAIPAEALEDPKRPGYLYNNVPKKVWGQYVGRAVEVLEEVYESVSNRQ